MRERERERWGRRERKEKRYVCDKSAGGLIVEIGIERKREREREGGRERKKYRTELCDHGRDVEQRQWIGETSSDTNRSDRQRQEFSFAL